MTHQVAHQPAHVLPIHNPKPVLRPSFNQDSRIPGRSSLAPLPNYTSGNTGVVFSTKHPVPNHSPKPAAGPSFNEGLIPGRTSLAPLPHHPGGKTDVVFTTVVHPLPNYHPKPVVRPTVNGNDRIPGRTSIASSPKTGYTSGNVAHLGTNLRAAHAGSGDNTRAILHAQSLVAAIQTELARLATGRGSASRLQDLEKQLEGDLHRIQG